MHTTRALTRALTRAFLPALLAGLLLMALAPAPAQAVQPALSVAVTIPPQAYFVERIAGDLAKVDILVPAGADPHSYEPKPSQVAGLARADLWLSIGVEFEQAWKERLLSANPDLAVAPMDQGVTRIPMDAHGHHHEHGEEVHEEHHGEEGHQHTGLDPHIWTAPPLVKVLAHNTAQALIQADPAHADEFQANLAAFQADLDALDAQFRALFSSLPQDSRTFLVYHPAWGYFADAYGLTQVVVEAEGKEPGARELMELIDFAKAHHVRTVFVQPQFSDKSAQVVAEAIHGSVVKADPLARDWADNMEQVARAFRQAMEKE